MGTSSGAKLLGAAAEAAAAGVDGCTGMPDSALLRPAPAPLEPKLLLLLYSDLLFPLLPLLLLPPTGMADNRGAGGPEK